MELNIGAVQTASNVRHNLFPLRLYSHQGYGNTLVDLFLFVSWRQPPNGNTGSSSIFILLDDSGG